MSVVPGLSPQASKCSLCPESRTLRKKRVNPILDKELWSDGEPDGPKSHWPNGAYAFVFGNVLFISIGPSDQSAACNNATTSRQNTP